MRLCSDQQSVLSGWFHPSTANSSFLFTPIYIPFSTLSAPISIHPSTFATNSLYSSLCAHLPFSEWLGSSLSSHLVYYTLPFSSVIRSFPKLYAFISALSTPHIKFCGGHLTVGSGCRRRLVGSADDASVDHELHPVRRSLGERVGKRRNAQGHSTPQWFISKFYCKL